MNLPTGDMLMAAMSAKWTDTATIDVGADPVLFSASELHSAPLAK
jgi:hypothetical protein